MSSRDPCCLGYNSSSSFRPLPHSREPRRYLCGASADTGEGEKVSEEAVVTRKGKKRPASVHPLTPPLVPGDFPGWAYEEKDFFRFELVYQSKTSRARVGRIHTPHGVIDTPGFVPVATNGTLKAVDHQAANEANCQLMFCNSYHLMIQPGPDVIEKAGGIHKFINRHRPIITDSGGFQVFSLSGKDSDEGGGGSKSLAKRHHEKSMLRVTEEGATFRSYKDGKKILLTPESSVRAQKAYGADIIVPLDELLPVNVDETRLLHSLYRTHRWEARSLQEHLKDVRNQAMYCVVHGGMNLELRKMSVEYLSSLPFDGIAIGGSLGRDRQELVQLLTHIMPTLPPSKPVHLLGIADLESIAHGVALGVDTFDSCYPTRMARHGHLITKKGRLKLPKAIYDYDYTPIEDDCDCFTCQNYTRAYLNHLLRAKEPVVHTLLTIHNLRAMTDAMARHRSLILEGST
eukprot:jgi/Bigna1/133900/aug1.23_g8608